VGALSVTTVACGGAISTGTGSGEKDAGSSDGTTVGQAAYGGSPPEDASANSGGEDAELTGFEAGVNDAPTGFDSAYGGIFVPPDANVAVPYGLPPLPDAGSTDADSRPDVVHFIPPYGAMPPPEKP